MSRGTGPAYGVIGRAFALGRLGGTCGVGGATGLWAVGGTPVAPRIVAVVSASFNRAILPRFGAARTSSSRWRRRGRAFQRGDSFADGTLIAVISVTPLIPAAPCTGRSWMLAMARVPFRHPDAPGWTAGS